MVDKTQLVIGPKKKLLEVPTDVDAKITDRYTTEGSEMAILKQYRGNLLTNGLKFIKS